jgi:hypothetical protein
VAIEEYLVLAELEKSQPGVISRTWNGAKAGAQIMDPNIKKAKVFIVEAESNAEALTGVRQLYGGSVTGKMTVVKKSLTEEL